MKTWTPLLDASDNQTLLSTSSDKQKTKFLIFFHVQKEQMLWASSLENNLLWKNLIMHDDLI